MTNKTWGRNMGQLGICPDQPGLVAGYNMVPRTDGTIEDLSGNGNHGTINGPVFEFSEIGPGMKFDGVDDELVTTYTGQPSQYTVCGWFNIRGLGGGNNGRLFEKGANHLAIYTGIGNTLTFRYNDGSQINDSTAPGAYLDNIATFICMVSDGTSVKAYINKEMVKDVAVSAQLNNDPLYLGSSGALSRVLDGSISNFQFFERALTPAEIEAEYNAGAKAVNFKTDYGVSTTVTSDTSGELSNSPFRVESGSFDISTDTINGCSAKVIECVTAGVVRVPAAYFHGGYTQAAHGTFECLMYQGNAANETDFVFIGNQNTAPTDATFNGYSLRFGSAQQVSLIKWTNGVLGVLGSTTTAAINTGQWYRVKVTVSAGGEFSFYLDDILVDVSGGSGSNPVVDASHTTSKHQLFSFGASDKAAYATKNGDCSIVKYQGIV